MSRATQRATSPAPHLPGWRSCTPVPTSKLLRGSMRALGRVGKKLAIFFFGEHGVLISPLAGRAIAHGVFDPHSGLLRKPPLPRSTGERKRGGAAWRLSSTPRSGG